MRTDRWRMLPGRPAGAKHQTPEQYQTAAVLPSLGLVMLCSWRPGGQEGKLTELHREEGGVVWSVVWCAQLCNSGPTLPILLIPRHRAQYTMSQAMRRQPANSQRIEPMSWIPLEISSMKKLK